MLEIHGISKRFGERQALQPLELNVPRGEIFGLLGHNGAGKSTTLGILLGHVRPDSGEVVVAGRSVQNERCRALRHVGAIFETPCFLDYLSGWQNLRYFVSLSGGAKESRIREVLELVGLDKRIHDPARTYSHGMRQRLALALALLPQPELLVLDEPNDGLDPEGVIEMRNLMFRLRDEFGMTILFSSHILTEVELLCGRIAILNNGRRVFYGDWRKRGEEARRVNLGLKNPSSARPVLENSGVTSLGGDLYRLPRGIDLPDLVSALASSGAGVFRVEEVRSSLEDFYMEEMQS
jgi:ABC-2 type transport system ATP-binding protein